MKTVQFHTDKGNVASGVRSQIKASMTAQVKALFQVNGVDLQVCDKGLAFSTGMQDASGKEIFAVIEMVITQELEKAVSTKTPVTKTAQVKVETPNIFGK